MRIIFMPNKKTADFNFEQSLENLQAIVNSLESEQLPLEQALGKFAEGVKLSAECQKSLQAAEQKVQILLKENGQEKLADFHEASDEDE